MNHIYYNIVLFYLFLAVDSKISDSCNDISPTVIECKCVENEELTFPSNLKLNNLTSLIISSCASVNIYSLTLGNAKIISNIVIQNISGSLTFEPHVLSRKIGIFRLNNIRNIPAINHDTFTSISSIDSFIIKDTRINKFDEQFTNINTEVFILQNVTIDHIVGINFSCQGETLKIIDSIIRNMDGNLNFAFFRSIEIINSTFEFKKPGDMAIEGVSVKIVDCVFTNVSMNLVARGNAVIKGNCADGKSSLRISSAYVNSYGNKLPTEIIYTQKGNNSNLFRNVNNTVCIAGNCKCPKSTGHNSYCKFHANIYLGIVLLVILHGL